MSRLHSPRERSGASFYVDDLHSRLEQAGALDPEPLRRQSDS
jgi:hypothetical protein